jgi:YD repeat-containing protein
MMKKRYRLLMMVCGLCLGMSSFAQNDMYDPTSVPTPNQSSLGLFGTIPVSHYTGTADVSIPLYSTNQRGVELNIGLCYNTSGLLINQLPGWTGHNWTLMAGGAITRKINGRPDEIDLKDTNAGLDLYTWYETAKTNTTPVAIINQKDRLYTNYFTNAVSQKFNLRDSVEFAKLNDYDSAADIFFFNFMGISGKFFFGGDGNWKVVCDRNMDVRFDVNDSDNYIEPFQQYYTCKDSIWPETWIKQPKTIKGFTLVDEDGNQYIFGGDKNLIEYSIPLVAADAYYNTTQPWNAISWMLKEVKDRFDNILYTFDYSRGGSIAQVQHAYNVIQSTYTPASGHVTTGEHETSKSPRGTLSAPLYLDGIHAADGTNITFNHTRIHMDSLCSKIDVLEMVAAEYPNLKYECEKPYHQQDHAFIDYYHQWANRAPILERINDTSLEMLRAITIKNSRSGNSNYSRKIHFLYSMENRMHLTSVILDEDTKYFFQYEGFDQLPKDYLTKQFDNWGYYNGIDYDSQSMSGQVTSGGNADYVFVAGSGVNGKPRVPNFEKGKLGMLKRIYYPTGGYSQLEYEQNTCKKYMSTDKKSCISMDKEIPVGGLRIKSIKNYDGDNLIGQKTYEYSGGELYSLPNSRYAWDFIVSGGKYHYVADMICSVVPLSNSFSSTLGYSQVREMNRDGSYTDYQYYNFSTEKDDPCVAIVPGQQGTSPYDETCSRQYMCGKLKSEKKYDSSGNLYQETSYEYDSDGEFNQNHYVTTASLCRITQLGGTAGSIYKLYYFNPGLVKKKTVTKFGTKWVTDEYTCEWQHTPLTISAQSGKSHVTDVFKITSETIRRGNDTSVTKYKYPFEETGTSNQLVKQFCLPVTYKKQYVNGVSVGGEKVTYKAVDGQIVPEYIYQFANNERQTQIYRKYTKYDSKFRAETYTDENGVPHNLLWNDYDQLTANIAKGLDKQIAPSGTISGMQSNNASTLFTTLPIMADLYEYDTQGRLKTTMSANLQRTDYSYDQTDRLTEVKWNGKTKTKYEYHQNNNTAIGKQCGYYTLNNLHVDASNSGRAGYIRVDYQLKYDVSNAEIKMIYVNSDRVVAQEALDAIKRTGKVWFKKDSSWKGAYMICLYEDGECLCEADTRLYY